MRILQLSLEDSYIAKKKSDSKVIKDVPLEPGKDLLFRIRFYRPFFHGKERHNSRHSVFSRDVVAPGCWELQELRDRVVCPNDADLRLDVSPAPHDAPETTSKVPLSLSRPLPSRSLSRCATAWCAPTTPTCASTLCLIPSLLLPGR
ncbi:unnamed protein product, partial [Iphiclides podalirius]